MRKPTYGKPCMSNLPPDLGRRVIQCIEDSKVPDVDALKQKGSKYLSAMAVERNQSDEQVNR